MPNQNPEQIARDKIDTELEEAGWVVQSAKEMNFGAGIGVAVREFQTDVGPVDYALFVNQKAVGVIEAKPENWGHRITSVEEQSTGYANAGDNVVEIGLQDRRGRSSWWSRRW